MHIAADFNLNLLDHDKNRKVHNFSINQELLINQLGLEKKKTATAIDHNLSNSFVDTVFKTAILKTDISDHFPICYLSPNPVRQQNKDKNTLFTKEHIH